MRFRSITAKILTLTVGSVVLTAAVLLALLVWRKSDLEEKVHEQVGLLTQATTGQIAQTVYRLCEAAEKRTQQRLEQSMRVADEVFGRAGQASFQDTVTWNAVNQSSHETRPVVLPKMLIGGNWLGQNRNPASDSPIVDQVLRYTGDRSTIFQRMNEEGDMLRVCTTVAAADGKRAIGTYVPRRNADGSENPVITSILSGKSYEGLALVVDQRCFVKYKPIWDSPKKQRVTGMLFVGVSLSEVNRDLMDSFRKMSVGKSGYVFILSGMKDRRFKYEISKDGKRDGQGVWETVENVGQETFQPAIDAALAAKPGTVIYHRYPWKNPGDAHSRMKSSAFLHFPSCDWVIGVGMYEEDYDGLAQASLAAFRETVGYALACALILIAVLGTLAVFMTRAITRPIQLGVALLGEVARGNVSQDVPATLCNRGDEIGTLGRAIEAMTVSLRETVHKLTDCAGTLLRSSADLSTTSGQMANDAQQMTGQSGVVAASAEQLASNMHNMASNADHMSDNAKNVASAVEEMTASISEIARSAEQAAGAAANATRLTQHSNETIGELGSSAGEIGKVIEVIEDIAEQTNLLALNATIEAARAGEAGRGFAVVANEVKELARQTAEATEDIQRRVAGIQSCTAKAVQAMSDINQAIGNVSEVSRTIASAVEEQSITTKEIAASVAKNSLAVETMARGVAESASVSQEITRSITHVDTCVKGAAATATFTQETSGHLSEITRSLQDIVEQFHTESAV
jgi:methyl-accepting chemotaxis protein